MSKTNSEDTALPIAVNVPSKRETTRDVSRFRVIRQVAPR